MRCRCRYDAVADAYRHAASHALSVRATIIAYDAYADYARFAAADAMMRDDAIYLRLMFLRR